MPWNLLILPLAGGYLLLSRLNSLKYKQQRLDRQRLIFDSILFGIGLLATTIGARYLIGVLFPGLIELLYSYLPIKTPYLGTATSSFCLAVIVVLIGNLTFCRNNKKEIQNAIKRVGNELELLLRSSFKDKKLLEFTLDTGKVYVVWVKELPVPLVSNYIRVIPVFSGFRDDELRINFTTHYLAVYSEYILEGKVQGVDELDVDLIITLDNVVTVSYFDIEMYDKFNSPSNGGQEVERNNPDEDSPF